jgi:hypothetical protein
LEGFIFWLTAISLFYLKNESLLKFCRIAAICVLLTGSEYWTLMKKQEMLRKETAQTRFVRAVARYRMANHKRNEIVGEELGISDNSTVLKESHKRNG